MHYRAHLPAIDIPCDNAFAMLEMDPHVIVLLQQAGLPMKGSRHHTISSTTGAWQWFQFCRMRNALLKKSTIDVSALWYRGYTSFIKCADDSTIASKVDRIHKNAISAVLGAYSGHPTSHTELKLWLNFNIGLGEAYPQDIASQRPLTPEESGLVDHECPRGSNIWTYVYAARGWDEWGKPIDM